MKNPRQFLAALSLVVCAGAFPQAPLRVVISPPEWKYGMISQGEIAETRVVAFNRGESSAEISFVPTCGCLTASPSSAVIAGGGSAAFELRFDSKDDTGITKRGFVVKSSAANAKPLYYLLSGVVRADRTAGESPAGVSASPSSGSSGGGAAAWASAAPAVELLYYYTPGCRSCEAFLSSELPRLEAKSGLRALVQRRDLLEGSAYEELSAFAASIGTQVRAIPALRLDGILLQGDEEIRARLPGLMVTRAAGGSLALAVPAAVPGEGTEAGRGAARLSILPVLAAGLIDGVNPCAFTTLIFLLATLALAGRGRREVLLIGALFSLGVFLTYLGIGLGLFAALRAASGVALVSVILRWVLFAALVAFAALSVYDFYLIRAGRASAMVLQLPGALKSRIHASIRTRSRSAALAGSSLVLGFLISIFEFACTGQVYLPTLAYLARVQRRADALGLLVAYNLSFILPLLAVFAASYLGVSSKRITTLFQAHMGKVKLALALAFLGLAIMTVAI